MNVIRPGGQGLRSSRPKSNNQLKSVFSASSGFYNAMKKSKSSFSQLILKIGRTPVQAGQHRCRVVETKTWRTNKVWSTSFVEHASRPNPLRPLHHQRIKICAISEICG